MSYRPIRKDLTEIGEDCFFCDTHLRSLKAYVLQNTETGQFVMAGPTCAQRNIADSFTLKGLPDLTKFTSATGQRESGGSGGTGGGTSNDSARRKAIEYLQLREEKLSVELKCSWNVLNSYYQSFLNGALDDNAVIHINNIENKAPEELKLSVLQKCYNYLFWIDVALSKSDPDKSDFLKSIRERVISRKPLSQKQFETLNIVLGRLKGVPQLK
ncbi:hypothetical protein SD340_004304 [Vibrio fluvialis]|nr:hypothetical protein [Vibrio fluvialis]EKO3528654.1 hypothetical protein [Vibrio fluvialis]ELC0660919.1 hypothetical protein [Vibrio fluvialis]ELU8402390.1 hypothetical protein [Vibrio fluvialis]